MTGGLAASLGLRVPGGLWVYGLGFQHSHSDLPGFREPSQLNRRSSYLPLSSLAGDAPSLIRKTGQSHLRAASANLLLHQVLPPLSSQKQTNMSSEAMKQKSPLPSRCLVSIYAWKPNCTKRTHLNLELLRSKPQINQPKLWKQY